MNDRTDPAIELVIIGDEILASPSRDINSAYLVEALSDAGYVVSRMHIVGDDIDGLADLFRDAAGRADVVLATGGLGPTPDDVTMEAAARAFGRELVFDEATMARIEELFRRRNRPMTRSNRKQAMVPAGATVVMNGTGTAPGIAIDAGGAIVGLMPGVPVEMRAMFADQFLPRIRERFAPGRIVTASLRITGISESQLFDRVSGLPGISEAAGFYPSPEGIRIRLRTGPDAPMDAEELRDRVGTLLGDRVFSLTDEALEAVVGRMLAERGLTIAVAESCTGGLVADRLTDVPGSSGYFLLGVTAYANEAKVSVLGVDPTLIAAHGAVSEPVACAMAEGVRRIGGADIGVATTGIAGPGGGTPEKPVGLMFRGLATAGGTVTKQLQFATDRSINKRIMAQDALNSVRWFLLRGLDFER